MITIQSIYRIINVTTGKSYIGQTINPVKRKRQHFSNLKCGRHENDYLQKVIISTAFLPSNLKSWKKRKTYLSKN
ncbi:GIY-YIG nuclease family protein [Bacillus sp. N9]